jgi:hypothetical protein
MINTAGIINPNLALWVNVGKSIQSHQSSIIPFRVYQEYGSDCISTTKD